MRGKYEPLTDALRVAAGRGQDIVELGFDQVSDLVGGLPPSADVRQWWANSSHNQALAWRAAGFHVDQVYLDRRRVRFAHGERGGSYHDRGGAALPAPSRRVAEAALTPIGPPVDVRVRLQWLNRDAVTLDPAGKPLFPRLEQSAGLYRLTLTGGVAGTRPRVYIGESENLHRRLSSNYRNPGAGQQTSLRINALLREHLGVDGSVALAVATTATVWLNGVEQSLDLTRKAGRLLAESAVVVLASTTDDAEIMNLG